MFNEEKIMALLRIKTKRNNSLGKCELSRDYIYVRPKAAS